MADSILQARAEVHRSFDNLMQWAESSARRSFWEFEREAWSRLMTLGCAVAVLFLARAAARPRPARYRHEGREYFLEGHRTSPLGTRFGKVSFRRLVGRRGGRQKTTCDLPVDRELDLCGGFSLGVVAPMVRLCAQLAFASARSTFAEFQGWAPSPRATLRMVDSVGERARPFLEQLGRPEDDGEILVIQVDGKGAPMISEQEMQRRRRPHRKRSGTRRAGRRLRRREQPRKRRTKGKKSKNAKVAFVGVIYTLAKTPDGIEGPINKRLCATFKSHDALFAWLRREADKRGYGRKRTLFIAEGLDHIWYQQKRYFPNAEPCVDWWHIVEKLWVAGECLHKEASEPLNQWIAKQTSRLRAGAVGTILREMSAALAKIPMTGPGNKGRRARLADVIAHIEKNRERMPYREFRQHDLDIGSGAAEGAVRNLVGMRLDGPGMRWGRGRSELVLHLRCILLNGQWSEFTSYLAKRGGLPLHSRPVPAETYDAKAAA